MYGKLEKAILVGLHKTSKQIRNTETDIQESMKELSGLAEAAGAKVAAIIIQNRLSRDAAYYTGKGKVEEVRELCLQLDASLVICNDELSGTQIRNIEEILEVKVLDRTSLILDIFAQRALSKEGKLQVELAQLRYRLPRLQGIGKEMSRTGGGIGTRGPGEQKLETDRRHILGRITDIKRELEEFKKNRTVQRMQRQKSQIPIVALVGYTNAGKSTLLNELIKTHKDYSQEKEVIAKDMLFASLDVTLRKAVLSNKREFLVVDTVGFVSDLPHDLIEAFKATLEEVKFADVIIHVIDISNDNYEMQMKTTMQVLKELKVENKPMLTVYNKIDLLGKENDYKNKEDCLYLSAHTRVNMAQLLKAIEEKLVDHRFEVTLSIPFHHGNVLYDLKNKYVIDRMEYKEEGIELALQLDERDYKKYQNYFI
ncbi:MAG: GTPase HflX [Candidatus Dichloromethanomonas elyunquensis]|nr:MAG: GTPase HflX [Candidatus Dichloromethanomonas elyunquensis]